jgi:phosphoglycerate dehydrogenase-like enzyme
MSDLRPESPVEAPRPAPVIVNQGGFKLGERLAAHWSSPRVLAHPKGAPPWEIPPEADVLVTQQHLWAGRAAAPPGWPFGLRFIQTLTTGVDLLPPWVLEGPVVACSRGVPAAPIAEFVLLSILAHEKRFDSIRVQDAAEWKPQWNETPLGTLGGKVLALAGYGALGRAIASRAQPFGMRILALRRGGGEVGPLAERAPDFASLVAEADHLVLALPMTAETRHILDTGALSRAKPTLHVVNVARGALVDDTALLTALDEGRIAAASLDVTEPEPLPAGHPFYAHPKVRLTPHISWSDAASVERLTDKILTNMDHYVRGEPIEDIVDPARGY